MSEVEFITDQLKRAFDGEAWHGPALMEILDGVDAAAASAHPIHAAHSIWELVLHICGWERVVAKRMQGETLTLSDDENFGHIAKATESAWRETLQALRKNHEELTTQAARLTAARLKERVPGKNYDLGFLLTGALQHVAYHAGQIALLKRASE